MANKEMKTVLLVVDALKSTYVTEENMPFLYGLMQNEFCIHKIYASPGFCERCELFSGLDCFDTGNMSAIGYMPERSSYKTLSKELRIAEVLSYLNPWIVRKAFNKYRIHKNVLPRLYRIPYKSLKNYILTEDGKYKFVEYEDIFTSLINANKSFTLDGFTSLSSTKPLPKDMVQFLIDHMQKNVYFIPAYLGIIDTVGHKYGKNISAIKPYLRKVDEQINQIFCECERYNYRLAVLGDHGMVPIQKKLDIQSEIKSLGIKLGKDYEVFYDSTMCRFWFYNRETQLQIINVLEHYSDYGKLITPDNANRYRIPMDIKCKSGKSIYGDVIWCCNPGIVISPDYFHDRNEELEGMHGYLETIDSEGTGVFVLTGKIGNRESAQLNDVCEVLCEALNICKPNLNWERRIIDES